ncbi:MAG TPA: hypothetical protein VI233_12970, partial [Puia sp.]
DKPLAFSVPEGYFEGFAQGLMDKIKAGVAQPGGEGGRTKVESASEELARLSPLLSGMSRQTPYQVPQGFFEELSSLHPILEELRDKPLYTVPEGYFAGLAEDVRKRLGLAEAGPARMAEAEPVQQAPAKVITLGRSFRQRSLWKYSAAAVVAGLMITIGWLRLNSPSKGSHPATGDVAGNLVKVSDQDLRSYLEDHNDDNDQNPVAEPMNSTATLDINDSDVKSLLGDVPDGELKQYMEEHGGASDIATN